MIDEFDGKELLNSGHAGCPGCGATLAMKLALRALGENTVLVIPACCWAILAGGYPQTSLKVPVIHTAFASTGAIASGIRAALDLRGERETNVVGWSGDGGTFDIGLQSLSAAAERGEDVIFICYDNEAYMNTGVQRSSSTPWGTRTMTTPGSGWKRTPKKNLMEIMAAHRIPYAATASIAFPDDLMAKIRKAAAIRTGTRFIHVFASCPTGWGMPAAEAVKVARVAVQCGIFPLYEVEDGLRYVLQEPQGRPVADYLGMQNRFRHLDAEAVGIIQSQVDAGWDRLRKLASIGA